jgi:hypothetical protein
VLGQDVQRTIELVEGRIPGLGQPLVGRVGERGPNPAQTDQPIEPALMAAELGARPGKAPRGHHQQGRLMRCTPVVRRRQPGGDRLADAEPGPKLGDHVDGAELEARLDFDPPVMSRCVCSPLPAVGVEHPADAAHQSLQRRPAEALGADEAVHHLGLDVACPGSADPAH